ncbi:MAG: hypothetical protein KR126chlam3_00361 [Chlamydiae bacterium]|nr:hypothetical protein [Chlamydiota bacterium]
MKKIISILTLCSFLTVNCLSAHEEIYYTDEDDELFNRGKFVGEENQDWLKAIRRERNKNWAIALGTTAVGIATLFLVGQHHSKNKEHHDGHNPPPQGPSKKINDFSAPTHTPNDELPAP